MIYSVSLSAQVVRDFSLKDLQNKDQNLTTIKGEKLTVLDFWASWCKPCIKSIPEINKIYNEYKTKGVAVIGVNCDGPRSVSKVGPMVSALKVEYPILLDMNSSLLNDLGLSSLPSIVIINSKNKVVWIHEGFRSGDEIQIRKELDKLLK